MFQCHQEDSYSNLACVHKFLLHIDEFEVTRLDEEKTRRVLFPEEIDSLFGIAPMHDSLLPLTESLEILITKFYEQGKLEKVMIGIERPYIQVKGDQGSDKIFLDDTPRLRQLYFDHGCFRKAGVHLDGLNFALKYIKSRNIDFSFPAYNNLRKIAIGNLQLLFVYEYCLSKVTLLHISPKEGDVMVNLHNWNGASCISKEAYKASEELNVKLLTMDDFYGFISKNMRKR